MVRGERATGERPGNERASGRTQVDRLCQGITKTVLFVLGFTAMVMALQRQADASDLETSRMEVVMTVVDFYMASDNSGQNFTAIKSSYSGELTFEMPMPDGSLARESMRFAESGENPLQLATTDNQMTFFQSTTEADGQIQLSPIGTLAMQPSRSGKQLIVRRSELSALADSKMGQLSASQDLLLAVLQLGTQNDAVAASVLNRLNRNEALDPLVILKEAGIQVHMGVKHLQDMVCSRKFSDAGLECVTKVKMHIAVSM